MDETKVQIGEEVLLDIGIHSEWYISSTGYDGESVDIKLRKKADRIQKWWFSEEYSPDGKPCGLTLQSSDGNAVDLVPAQKWIPCSERLPSEFKEGEMVLATTVVDGLRVVLMLAVDVERFYLKGYVYAWMPLPKP